MLLTLRKCFIVHSTRFTTTLNYTYHVTHHNLHALSQLSQACAQPKSNKFWQATEKLDKVDKLKKLGIASGCNKSFQRVVFILTQPH